MYFNSFHDGVPYHMETSPLNCSVNQWTGFYMIGTPIMKESVHSYHNHREVGICDLQLSGIIIRLCRVLTKAPKKEVVLYVKLSFETLKYRYVCRLPCRKI